MFNERGIEYVGLRELAAVLDMRVSNITYYFPTKDDLVYELALELRKTNAATIVPADTLSMTGFLEMLHQVFLNHQQFRCLLLSFVHLMEQNKRIASSYAHTQTERRNTLRTNAEILVSGGYLKAAGEETIAFLVNNLSLISRFWLSEAAVSWAHLSPGDQLLHYLRLVTQLLTPYATAKGLREIEAFAGRLKS